MMRKRKRSFFFSFDLLFHLEYLHNQRAKVSFFDRHLMRFCSIIIIIVIQKTYDRTKIYSDQSLKESFSLSLLKMILRNDGVCQNKIYVV